MKNYAMLGCIFFLIISCDKNNANFIVEDQELSANYLALIEKLDWLLDQRGYESSPGLEEEIKMIEKEVLEKYPDCVSHIGEEGKEGKECH
ncbi:MAG: hypothetical protein JXR70_07250 [Spirochaetales bacterium]|nr:hypothetical protein [Spirochaetales bacterium]